MSSPNHSAATLPASLAALGKYKQFILVQLIHDEARPGKTLKHPINAATGYRHDAHDPAIWMDYADAAQAVSDRGGLPFMLGFVITRADPFWFIDIDNCLTPSGWSSESMAIAALVPGAALEVSQSGTGLHILGSYRGEAPAHSSAPSADLGFYTEARFVALTCQGATGDITAAPPLDALIAQYFPPGVAGDAVEWTDTPDPTWSGPTDDAVLLAAALASGSAFSAFNGRATFKDLWTGNAEVLGRNWPDGPKGRAWEATATDAALASHLAFWTGKNCARIEIIMNRPDNALRRDKYDRPDREYGTYLRKTIVGAVARCSAVYGANRGPNQTERVPAAMNMIAPAGASSDLSFAAAAGGAIAATVANVEGVLMSSEAGVVIAYDEFKARICIREGERWRLFKNSDYGNLRASLERRGFKPVSAEVIKTVVEMVAERQRFNSATDRVAALVWDGVSRVTTALIRYYGVADTPYTRASSEYLFSALAGRSLSPGCQADMAVILVGVQGARKTSAVSALALDFDSFGAVNLSHLDDELARKVRGKTVLEWAELRGLSGRDQESIKDWISRRNEEFRDLYQSFPVPYARHFIAVGTSNTDEILDDPTGERRWLPQHAGAADVEALQQDIEQLWAEGAHMFRNGGIRWQEAERLAKDEHVKFKVYDERIALVQKWLDDRPRPSPFHTPSPSDPINGDSKFGLVRLMAEAFGMTPDRITMSEQKNVSKLLKGLGYVKKHTVSGKIWVKGS